MFRSIVHLDADAFFASVEQAADPRLRGRPIAVGGEKRGVIASASYEARKFGIYTPMPTVAARRLCPKLILLPGDFEKYELFSRLMFSYAYDFTPDVEIGSIDEGYFDLTGASKPPLSIAEAIRHAIRQSLKLPVSEGIGSSKLVSQIASKLKKPSAFQFVPHGTEQEFLSPLTNIWLPGVGPKLASQLNAAGLARIGQIARTPPDLLGLLTGSLAPQLKNFALGIDERPVVPVRAAAKSYGEQETFASDTTDEEFLEATLRRMADKLMAKVRADGKSIRTVTVKVRYNDMDEQQASQSLSEPTELESDIYSTISALLRKAWARRVSLRLVSLKLSNVYEGLFRGILGLDASTRRHDAQQRLAVQVDELRQKYGRSALMRGHDLVLRDRGGGGKEPGNEDPAGRSADIPTRSDAQILGRSADVPIRSNPRIPNQTANIPARSDTQILDRSADVPIRSNELHSHVPPNTPTRSPIRTPQRTGTSALRTQGQTVPQTRTSRLRNSAFVPLNAHSHYSFLDSTLSIKALVDLAARHELPAIALTDRNNLHGAIEFAQTAASAGIKAIIGAEIERQGKRLCLYVENQKGYANLCRILSEHPDRPRDEPSESSPALWTAAGAGVEAHAALGLRPTFAKARSIAPLPTTTLQASLQDTEGLLAVSPHPELAPFFPKRFYLEATNPQGSSCHHPALPCVASFPIHYASPTDRQQYDILQSIRTLTLLRQRHPEKRLDGDFHFRNRLEMGQLFSAQPHLLAHSLEIADRCSFTFSLGKPQFPAYPTPDGSPPAAFLRKLVMEGLRRRYPKNHSSLTPQLEQELAIITDVGYEEYFLVMWDILQECRRRGIEWITRGSAADSLACYCLEISGVCPIRFDLYFRRFLNKDRMALNKLPDIDVDFAHDRKDDVIDLIFEKYGPEHAAVVGGFSTFQARSAFAEVAKVLGVSEYQARRLTERFPYFSRAGALEEAVAGNLECRDLPLNQEPYSTALKMAQFLDGFPRYPKMHPCGLVLSRQPMREITPCFTSAKGYPTTHFDMDSVECAGLVKMDILAQGGLAVMRDVNLMLSTTNRRGLPTEYTENTEKPLPLDLALNLAPPNSFGAPNTFGVAPNPALAPAPALNFDSLEPWEDPEVWDLIASGSARAVHHIESPAMISLCKMCNVRDIDTLIAIVSVIRPGAANESKKMEFARRYQGLSPVRYPHPSLERCLRSTYGLVVYEEHILQICEAFAGLPPGRADVLRRALAKEKTEVIHQIQAEFADCARRLGRTEDEISLVWELVAGFRGYAFCKAHSTAYGVEAYQSAWLKRYYPAEFMAAVLTNGKGFYHPLVYVLECHRLGIPLLPPFVNEPGPAFTVIDGNIRVPVLRVKGLTRRTGDAILRERDRGEFSSLADFLFRVQPLPEEMESLIQVGAFDPFGKSRAHQYWEFKSLNACATESRGSSRSGARTASSAATR